MERRISKKAIERFESKITKTDSCWLYGGYKTGSMGYGYMRVGNKYQYAHRVSYQIYKGRIPKGEFVCHSCDVPLCVNPEHLWTGSAKDNKRDSVSKGRSPGMKGNNNPNRRITSLDVFYIRELYASGDYSHKELAEHYDISHTTIRSIVNRILWK